MNENNICVGNIIYFKNEIDDEVYNIPVKVMGIDSSYRMDGSKRTVIKIYGKTVANSIPISLTSGIPLSDDILEKMGAILDKEYSEKNPYGNSYVVYSYADTNIIIQRDWNKYPSYHVGIEYTDSPFEQDQNNIYHFSHQIKYVHELQNIISSISTNYEFNEFLLNVDNLLK